MARIPTAIGMRRTGPKLGTGVVRESGANADLGLGGLAAGIGRVAERGSRLEVAKAKTAFRTAQQGRESGFDEDDDYGSYEERYRGGLEEDLGAIAKGISSPVEREMFLDNARLSLEDGAQRIKQKAFVKVKDTERGEINTKLNDLRKLGVSGQVGEASALMAEMLDSAVELDYYGAEEAARVKQAWKQDLAVERLTSLEPDERLAELQKPWAENLDEGQRKRLTEDAQRDKYDGYSLAVETGDMDRAGLEALRSEGGLEDKFYESLLGKVDRQERLKEREDKVALSEAQASAYAELQVGIDDGKYTRADVDRLRSEGRISDSQWSTAARQANNAKDSLTKSASFASALASGLPIDPYNTDMKKGADALFKSNGGRSLFQEDFNRGLAETAKFAQAGIIPTEARSVMRGYISNGTPEQQMQALDGLGQLYDTYETPVDAAFSASEVSEAISYRDKLDAGIPPEVAYDAILTEREAANEKGGFTDIRLAQARKIAKDFELKDALKERDEDGVTGLFGRSIGGKVGSDAKASNDFAGDELTEMMILNDYQQAFQTYYLQNGDEELSKRQAAAVMGRTVGRSKTNKGRAMLHPPEKYYSIGDGDKWMRDSLVKAVSDMRGAEGGDTRFKDVELVADGQTAREVRNGQSPTYFVMVTERDGTKTPLQGRWDFTDERNAQIEGARSQMVEDNAEAQSEAIVSDRREIERDLEAIRAMKTGIGWANMSDEDKQPYLDSEAQLRERLAMRQETIGGENGVP